MPRPPALLPLALLLACSPAPPPAGAGPSAAPAPADDLPAVLAAGDGGQITMADVRLRIGEQLDQNEARYRRTRHTLVEGAVRDLVRERLLEEAARRRSTTVEQLLAAEAGGSLDPADADIAAFYRDNLARMGGRTLEQVGPQIASYLRTLRRRTAEDQLVERLGAEQGWEVHIGPYRVTFDDAASPALGPPGAPVTLVEFSDFQCPFCAQFHTVLDRLHQEFGDRLRIVYRQFPIASIHPQAAKAAEASLCAHDQGKFWEMHDLIFQNLSQLAVPQLKGLATRLDLDQSRFDACLDTGVHAAQVQADLREGTRAGVTGTPALFVNGVFLEGGALPYEAVAEAVRQELARLGR